jgi:hypothetical protein
MVRRQEFLMAKTLVDVYREAVNKHPRVIVTQHAIERMMERKIDFKEFYGAIREITKNICLIIYETELLNNYTFRFKYNKLKVPVKFDKNRMVLLITTVY